VKKIQYERWKDFTYRMIYSGVLGNLTEARKERLWKEAKWFIEEYKAEPVDGWDGDYNLCDSFHEWFNDYLDSIWKGDWEGYKNNPRYFANQLEIVIRASVNAAIGEGSGVIGFTVGDLRQMYGGELPRWISGQYENLTRKTPDTAGVFL